MVVVAVSAVVVDVVGLGQSRVLNKIGDVHGGVDAVVGAEAKRWSRV